MSATDSLLFDDLPETPDYLIEERLRCQGFKRIAGIDEVGRGPLAGPVVAATVVLDPARIPDGLNDSKKLNEKQREKLFDEILLTAEVAWTSLPASIIDATNIRAAALEAMTRSCFALAALPDAVLIDGRDVPEKLGAIGRAYVKGDARSVSIAAASIVAKVIRDRMMREAGETYPHYGFAGHKGYGSKLHRDAISEHGPCPIHRMSFSPIRKF